jgi:hypothetical protein
LPSKPTADAILWQAVDAGNRRDFAKAERLCRSLLETSPRHFWAWVTLGDIFIKTRRTSEALAAYETAIGIDPGYGAPFSRAAMIRFRMAFGEPPRPRSYKGRTHTRVQKTTLGGHGRFGNQLLQYAFVRLHAAEHDLIAEFPDWIGRDLFDLDDPLPSASLLQVNEKDFDLSDMLGPGGPALAERDVIGSFVGTAVKWADRAAEFRALFTPGAKIRPLLDGALHALKRAGNTVVAIHIRHGDFGYGKFWIAPPNWYLAWLRRIWPELDTPVLYVATDDSAVVPQFAEFSPWDRSRLGVDIPGADFIVDHHILQSAAHVAISNSTFSFTAAMLNERALGFMRPHPDRRELVPFEPWTSPVQLHPVIEDSEAAAADRAVLEQHFRPAHSVVHIGRHCSPWTHLARSVVPRMRVHELGEGASIDRFCGERDGARITHLVVESIESLSSVVSGAAGALSLSGIDMVHFRVPLGRIATVPDELRQDGYELLVWRDGSLSPVDGASPLPAGYYIAVSKRALEARVKPS